MIFYLVATIALVLIAVIMLCRANDLRWHRKPVMRFRLIGLIVSGFSTWGVIGWDFYINRQMPTPFMCCLLVGLSFVFVTTPNGVPFWKWIWQGEETE